MRVQKPRYGSHRPASQQQIDPVEEPRPRRRRSQQELASEAGNTLSEVNTSVALLSTEADRARGLLGFGRRILVPPDEIHIVVGDGIHTGRIANERKGFVHSSL